MSRPSNRRGERRRTSWRAAGCVCIALSACGGQGLPAGLADRDWWALSEHLSEPHRDFRVSENLLSNEAGYAERVRWLRPSGGVYIGVGPEQNFSYIAALQPDIAFIVDIRHENRLLHLIYKALFEVSADRAEFLSRLFSRTRPAGLSASSTAEELFTAVSASPPADAGENRSRILDRLLTTRTIPLTTEDRAWIARTLTEFQQRGPGIQYWDTTSVDVRAPSYRELMLARDSTGVPRSFVATEAAFRINKELHTRNLIVPVVGDFAGPRALRRIGDYARQHGARVEAFYASNVGAYLNRTRAHEFCGNLATLPAAGRAAFIEANRMQSIARELLTCAADSPAHGLH
jgi:hypothetical protein